MILKCWIVATIVGIMMFSAGILSVALYYYLTSRPERDSLGLRGWLWLDVVKSHLKDKKRPPDKSPEDEG